MKSNTHILTRRHRICDILKEAGEYAKERFYARDFLIQTKGLQDYVSEVDREVEDIISRQLLSSFPEDSFLGEESGGVLGSSTWIIDPIDGTSNYVRGIEFWCLSAALVVDGKAVVAAIYDPIADEMFSCHHDGGATVNGNPIVMSKTNSATNALLGMSLNAENSHAVVPCLGRLLDGGSSFRFMGAGALSLAHCAAGRTDGFYEAFMLPWDAAAGLALVTEAGGVVCDFGANNGYAKGNPVLASNRPLADYFSTLTSINVVID